MTPMASTSRPAIDACRRRSCRRDRRQRPAAGQRRRGLKAHGHAPFVIIAGGEKADLDELGSLRPRDASSSSGWPISVRCSSASGITHVVLAGGIGRRPRLTQLRPTSALLSDARRVLLPLLARATTRCCDGRRADRGSTATRSSARMRSCRTCWPPRARSPGASRPASRPAGPRRRLRGGQGDRRARHRPGARSPSAGASSRSRASREPTACSAASRSLRAHGRLAARSAAFSSNAPSRGRSCAPTCRRSGRMTVDGRARGGACRHRRRGRPLAGARLRSGARPTPTRSASSSSACTRGGRERRAEAAQASPIIAGEESGDLLGADLVQALRRDGGRPVELVGVGGRHLEERGPEIPVRSRPRSR